MSDAPLPDEYVAPDHVGRIRVDRFAAAVVPGLPTVRSAYKAARRGELWLNGEVCESSRFVNPGDRLRWVPGDRPLPRVYERPIEVLFMDDQLAVVLKPAGLRVSGNVHRTLEHALPTSLALSPAEGALPRPAPVHRLDARTSGLLAVARTATAAASLGRQFQAREVHKRYRALLIGRLDGEGVVEIEVEGRHALTRYAAVEHTRSPRSDWLTTVDLFPVTGRTHQLRRHMAHVGHPVLGDGRYGIPGMVLRGAGLFLCAVQIRLRHPITGEAIDVTAPEPAKFDSHRRREQRRWERLSGT